AGTGPRQAWPHNVDARGASLKLPRRSQFRVPRLSFAAGVVVTAVGLLLLGFGIVLVDLMRQEGAGGVALIAGGTALAVFGLLRTNWTPLDPQPWSLAGSRLAIERDRKVIHANATFTVFLTMDLANAAAPSGLRYEATILARPLLGSGQSM